MKKEKETPGTQIKLDAETKKEIKEFLQLLIEMYYSAENEKKDKDV